jgi:hypothetical protein
MSAEVANMTRPEQSAIDAAHQLLERLATGHGLCNLRHGDEVGEVVADVQESRSYFDVVAFEEDVEGRLGWRPNVVSSAAPGARPGRRIGAASNVA